uniref:Lipocalin n=1 Tax=Caenorhabditis tropicalis TaxID=1561998 RepID=A0A1I7TT08_9PELO
MKFLLLVLTVSAVESIETTPPSGEWTPLYAQSLAPSDDNTLQHIETTPPSGEWTPLHTVPSGDYTPQYIASTSQSFNYATESADQIEDEEFGNPNKQCKRFEFKFNNELIKAVRCTESVRDDLPPVIEISILLRFSRFS